MNIGKIIGLILLIVVAVLLIQRSQHPKPPDEQYMPGYGIGQVLAEAAAKATHEQGRVVLACQPSNLDSSVAEMEGFQKTLSKHSQLKLTATRTFKPEETSMGKLSFAQFAALVNENASVEVIVCMLGITSFTDAQIASLSQPCPKLVVVDWNPADVQRGLNAGLIKAAVMTRELTSLPTDNPKTPREWFDRYYTVVSAQPGGNNK